MTDKEINEAIAEACGWIDCGEEWRRPDGSFEAYGPDYCNDMNAMHNAEDALPEHLLWAMQAGLVFLVEGPTFHATARQRAEAFLRTVGKWVD